MIYPCCQCVPLHINLLHTIETHEAFPCILSSKRCDRRWAGSVTTSLLRFLLSTWWRERVEVVKTILYVLLWSLRADTMVFLMWFRHSWIPFVLIGRNEETWDIRCCFVAMNGPHDHSFDNNLGPCWIRLYADPYFNILQLWGPTKL